MTQAQPAAVVTFDAKAHYLLADRATGAAPRDGEVDDEQPPAEDADRQRARRRPRETSRRKEEVRRGDPQVDDADCDECQQEVDRVGDEPRYQAGPATL
jgi:hypothetical protein